MKQLFVIYIGGGHQDALIELHDMRFVVAERIEETYAPLRQSWWGKPESLHLDAWGVLHWADGYRIGIQDKEPSAEPSQKLYFVNLGGYDSAQFTELHKNVFVVAEDPKSAKAKALKQISNWESPHRDYQFDVDALVDVGALIAEGERKSLVLTPSENEIPFEFTCQYVPIGLG